MSDILRNMESEGIAEAAMEAAEHFSVATGVGCAAVAPDGRRFPRSGAAAEGEDPFPGCAFCAVLQRHRSKSFQSCAAIHRYGTVQAERFGGSYLYFCPLNLTHWAAPVRVAGVTVASLIGGPVLMVKHEDYFHEDLRRFRDLAREGMAELRAAIAQVPYVDTVKTRSLAAVLQMEAQAVAFRFGAEPQRETGKGRDSPRAVPEQPKVLPRYPISKERELLFLISKGDLDGSRRALNDILGFIFFYSNHELDLIKLRVQELVVLLSRAAIEGGASIEEIIGLNDRYLLWIQDARSVYDLSSALAVLLTRFVECVFSLKTVKHADVIQKAVRYIGKQYAGAITLEDVAFHVGLSESHFSRLFLEGTGGTFIDFLTETRLRAGKELLADPSIPLAEVASRVGFEDQSYFTRVFSKRTGISPERYRKRKGLAESEPLVDESDIEIHE